MIELCRYFDPSLKAPNVSIDLVGPEGIFVTATGLLVDIA
jgi:hypothetical protein